MRGRAFNAVVLCFIVVLLSLQAQAQDNSLIGPDSYPPGVNPLTGLTVANPDNLNRRPLMIKVINAPASVRPQSGLMSADLVWEHLLSGGVTRFSAVYYSQDADHVGPIRSLRLVDFELARIYRSLAVYSGVSQGTLDVLRKDALMSKRAFGGAGPCPALCRFPEAGKPLEHTLYADIGALRQRAVELHRDLTPEPVYGMAFSASPLSQGIPVNGITIDYRQTSVNWTYDPVTGRWLRSQDGAPHFDQTTSAQISAANVLILEDDHIEQPVVSNGYWGPENYAVAINLMGKGKMALFRDGQYLDGEWRRTQREDPLTYFDLQGNTLPFKPGNTFIQLVPRWKDGYQLSFALTQPGSATVAVASVNLRKGPGSHYPSGGPAFKGDMLAAIGRNNAGDWIQVVVRNQILWVSSEVVTLDRDVLTLPAARSTIEQ